MYKMYLLKDVLYSLHNFRGKRFEKAAESPLKSEEE
jgi:hypothetical protein